MRKRKKETKNNIWRRKKIKKRRRGTRNGRGRRKANTLEWKIASCKRCNVWQATKVIQVCTHSPVYYTFKGARR